MALIKEKIKFEELKVHRAISDDGTEIAGRVIGQGPPLLFLPAGPGDSETSWHYLLPHLSDKFSCYLINTRNRGLSGISDDLSPKRLAEDVRAFAKSIGEPVGLVCWGPFLSLAAVENEGPIAAVAAYEPVVFEVAGEEEAQQQNEMLAQMGEMAAEGKFAEAARFFIENNGVYNDEEVADGAPSLFWDTAAPNIPVFLQELDQANRSVEPNPTDPKELEKIKVPFLLLKGAKSNPFFIESVEHYAKHVADPYLQQIVRAGHFGPQIEPEAVARELVDFFEKFLKE